jgi:uroporphyrinogen-III synthase
MSPDSKIGPASGTPLAGMRVVVTRAGEPGEPLGAALAAAGAEVLHFAAIRIEPLPASPVLRSALADLARYDWAVFTSANAVERFWAELQAAGIPAAALRPVRICAIGPATAEALTRRGAPVHLVPARHMSEGALEALLGAGVGSGSRVLLPRAEVARAVLPEGLRAAGAEVDDVPLYRTVVDGVGAGQARAAVAAGQVGAIVFTAASTVRSFVELVGRDLRGALTVSIGPATSAALLGCGLAVDIEAAESTVPGLVRALVSHAAGRAGAE